MNTNVKKDERTLKVGILGCGTICQAAHFEAAQKAKNVELYAICDIAKDLLDRMEELYHPQKVYSDYKEMLKDPMVDAIIIGVADQFHAMCAKQAILAGKHVLVEKPLGVSVEECEELQALLAKENLIFQVGNMKRFDAGLQFANRFIKEEIGDVTTFKAWYCDSSQRYKVCDNVMPVLYSSVTMKKPKGDPKENKEVYYLLGHASHLFDTARYMMGEIVSVEAKHVQKDGLYSWLIACEFANGAIGNLDLTIAARKDWHEGMQIYGTNGTIEVKTYNPWIFRTSDVICWNDTKKLTTSPYDEDGHFFRRQLEGFSDTILNGSKQLGATIEDGIATLKALIATHQSVQANGKRIVIKEVGGNL
ncbi:putative dehydrogenase [Breznakia sp. PF5-3]|uniref:Gfo/Idh/MocA family protein n=1 Tax=unclassified Breznakia TaxID=2623764 RepID=UPI002404F2F1|nr:MULTISPECIES: Gfo/Idh/MocA family oxidoreductase [unclassified Breznakia]MDL2276261.1 Gfo/Idh/MocA family oxidoreductase [Breznakia sp. OttesenSCG-928-G09]MDF9824919.1 putative dehydrogenase [Breznakia sp. PM6-1]MDF9835582.1 putative dehydrogenase [Breznakia sp. PF5-3]MDF9838002.1 putative dehydrogenase [Breznakia sp. PFB2-8]MDF9859991.1 putative dehydrogenase [Breznakia sp. PH5-24]